MQGKDERAPGGPWRVPVSIHEIPETGRRFELVADETTRAAIAAAAGLSALPRLAATFDVSRRGADGLRVAGRVCATVGQICVVTLDPIENRIEELVEIDFVSPAATAVEEALARDRHLEVTTEEMPELLHGDTVDLGALAAEFLMLAIDPYPRKPGVVFQAPPTEAEGEHPFAALASLRRGGQGGNPR